MYVNAIDASRRVGCVERFGVARWLPDDRNLFNVQFVGFCRVDIGKVRPSEDLKDSKYFVSVCSFSIQYPFASKISLTRPEVILSRF